MRTTYDGEVTRHLACAVSKPWKHRLGHKRSRDSLGRIDEGKWCQICTSVEGEYLELQSVQGQGKCASDQNQTAAPLLGSASIGLLIARREMPGRSSVRSVLATVALIIGRVGPVGLTSTLSGMSSIRNIIRTSIVA